MEELVIDGCNLAYKAFGGADRERRERLIRKLAAYYQTKMILVTVVFDSREGAGVLHPLPNLRVRYAPAPADDFIVKIVADSSHPASLTVITDDRSVGDRSRAYGARHIGSRAFLEGWKGWEASRPASPESEKPSLETPEQLERYRRIWE
ncbi:MAG: NYN domain-containing protein [Candidatus Aureabacteria bacterium]|nr:NYN domain-containing protein [Candidatus Auribacterota bacterium]